MANSKLMRMKKQIPEADLRSMGLGGPPDIYFSLHKAIQHEVVLLRPMRRKLHGIKTLSLSSLDSRSEHAGICRSGAGGHA